MRFTTSRPLMHYSKIDIDETLIMPASSMPQWKVALLERKKNDKIPTWKKELLKRIHAKDEAVRQSFIFGVHENEDGSILNEHILKVSDNIFVRMELQRKMTSSHSLGSEKANLPLPRRHHSEVITEELPSEGMVDRLKGQFGTETRRSTSLVTSSTPTIDYLELDKTRSTSTSDAKDFSKENNCSLPSSHLATLSHLNSVPLQESRNRNHILLRSIDVMTPKGFTRCVPKPIVKKSAPGVASLALVKKSTSEVTSPPLIKKFSAPVLNKGKPPLPCKSDLVLKLPSQCIHTQKSTTPPTTDSEADFVTSSTPPPPIFDRTVVTSSASLKTLKTRSSLDDAVDNDSFTPRVSKPIPKKRTTRTPSATPTEQSKDSVSYVLPALQLASSSRHNENREPIDGCHVIKISDNRKKDTKIGADIIFSPPGEYKEDFVKSEVMSSDVVETQHTKIIDVIESKPGKINSEINVAETKTYSTTQQNGDGSQVTKLGKTSLDSSFAPQNAIALNEIVKNSRSFQIVPSNARKLAQNNKEKSEIAIASVSSKHNIPVTCDDAVLKTSHQLPNNGSNGQTSNAIVTEPAVVAVTRSKPLESAYLSAKDEKANEVKQKEVIEPAKCQKSAPFPRPRLSGPGVVSTKSFGGKSFLIDPSKFKKSTTSTTDNSSKVSVGATDCPSSQTKVENSVSSGKRKLRADQITVIGGYVKLSRSSLSKPDKTCKKIRVKFEESLLESVYHYPSEESLLNEGATPVTTSLHTHPLPSRRDSHLDKYTIKSLLARHEEITSGDEDDD